jgi:hypothetical protein
LDFLGLLWLGHVGGVLLGVVGGFGVGGWRKSWQEGYYILYVLVHLLVLVEI